MDISLIHQLYRLFLFPLIFFYVNPFITGLLILGWWKIFEKAGVEGWKSLIPFYHKYLKYEMALGEGRGWLFLVSYTPMLGLIIKISYLYMLAQAFGKGIGYTIGLLFLKPVFILILAFDSSSYEGGYYDTYAQRRRYQ